MLRNQNANKIYFKSRFPLVGILVSFFICQFWALNSPSLANYYLRDIEPPQNLPIGAQWCFSIEKCFSLEVAETDKQRRIGLMRRKSLPSLTGMWFKFPSPQIVEFWMKDMLIPVDMIFLLNGVVLALENNVQICNSSTCPTYGPSQYIDGVIELVAGEVERLNIEVGDYLDIQER